MMSAMLALALTAAQPADAPVFHYDFEQSEDFADYEGLSTGNATPAIVTPGADGQGHCVRLTSLRRGKYCTLTLAGPMPVVKNLVLSFDYRTEIEEGVQGQYLGILFFYEDGKQFGRFDHHFSPEWRHAEVPIGSLRSPNEGVLEIGREFARLNLYGRAPEDGGLMTVWLDNIRLGVKPMLNVIRDRVETSYANPPMFAWGESLVRSRLQYSRSPEFPEHRTVTVATDWTFHTPPAPLEPGEWFWRTYTETELTEGWGEIHRLRIPEQAHQFTTPPVDAEALAAMPRPRLIDVEAERERLGEDGIASLIARAESSAEQPIPDDPPIWEEGDERWPDWIDWYRDVAGGITGRTGRRLEQMARWAAITGDEQVAKWTTELALAVASWDPDGGSAMSRGDIAAQHLLRGLNTAYDVLHERLTDDERAMMRDVIVTRAQDFWAYLNPLRANPHNNHAWLKALALGQSGLVLVGDHDQAHQWAEYCRQLFVGKFLSGLGFQGENNEGLSYWSYGLSFIIEYADMMRTVCGIDLYEHPWLSRTARFPMYCAPPNAWGVSFADTGRPNHGARGPYAQSYVGMLAERTGDPYALWYSGRREGLDDLAPRPPVDLPQSIHYRFIGLAIANTSLIDGREGATVAMHSGPFWAGHQHADQNAFVIHAYGEKLAIDSGYYDWYGSPHFKQYSIQTVAHNSILVDGEGQAAVTKGADGRIDAWFDGTGHTWMVGDASDPEVYGGRLSRFDRRVLFVKPGLVIMHDLLEAPEPSSFQWLLHTVAPIEIDESRRALDVVSGDAAMSAEMLRPAELSFSIADEYPVHPYDGYGTVPVPEEELAEEWHLTAEAQPAAERQFLTVFDVRRSAEDAASIREIDCEGGVGLQVARGGGRTTVLLAPDRQPVSLSASELAAVAEVASVTTERGALASACAVHARELRWRGELLFAIEEGSGDCSLVATERGLIADLSLHAAATVRLPAAHGQLIVDGEHVRERVEADKHLTLALPVGEHTIAWGRSPDRALSHPLEPLAVRVGDTASQLQGHARRRATDLRRYWWGPVELPADDRYEVRLEAAGPRSRVTWDGRGVELEAEGEALTGVIWDEPGQHHMTISAAGPIRSVALVPRGVSSVAAEMLSREWSPPEGAILHEAEDVAEEGGVKGRLMEKVGASGGIAHAVWDSPGQWARWRIEVSAEGDYQVLIRAASVYDRIARDLQLDGELLQVASFASTGGWCRTTDDWRWFRLMTEAGQPLAIHLSAGEHALRMTRLAGSMNLDLFALVPAQ
ncbi:MAG: DUF4962 domain-containing protein [Armatimonadota bacterium]|nr:DUF4962 domain-containing protein [Armatimonadota bacterium]